LIKRDEKYKLIKTRFGTFSQLFQWRIEKYS